MTNYRKLLPRCSFFFHHDWHFQHLGKSCQLSEAIVVLECETGKVVTTSEIQAYLEVQFGIKETLERIKEARDIVYEVSLNAETEE